MTDEQINQRIAEACGLICLHEFQANKDGVKFGYWEYPKTWTGPKKQPWCLDFCHDLNAMHEAEEFLSGNCWIEYVNILGDIEGTLFGIRATASQRAEAFLRTLGKWEATDKDSLTVHPATTEQSSVDHLRDATKMVKEVQK